MSFDSWERKKLIDVTIKIGSGATPRGGSKSYKNEGIPFIRSQNIYNCEFNPSGLVYIDDDQANKLSNVEIEEDDVLLNITGDSVARCTIVPTKYIGGRVNQHVSIIRTDKSKLIPSFLKYYLVDPKMQNLMLSWAQSGGTRAALTKGMIESLEISLPSITEQKVIADILSSLDEKIEINNQINKKLEEMAQTIFKQWFVDFEFPNENGEPYKSSGGEMVESELGLIPIDWKIGDIYNIIDVKYGAAYKSKQFNENGEGLPLIRIRDLKNANPLFYTTEKHPNETIVNIGDILLGMDAEFTPTIWKGKKAYLNQRVCQLKPNKDYVHKYYVYELIKPFMKFYEHSKVGTTVIHLGKADIDKIRICIPTKEVLKEFSILINPIFQKILEVSNENLLLKEIRDTLLPKLMSGEIRVPVEE